MVAARDDSCELLDMVENDDGSHMVATGRGGAARAASVTCARLFFSSVSATCMQAIQRVYEPMTLCVLALP